MGTCNKLICCESKLKHNIRFVPRNYLSEAQIRELIEERKNVRKSCKKIEEAKGPTQLQLKQLCKAITGNATVSSNNDPIGWGTHTPAPTKMKMMTRKMRQLSSGAQRGETG